MSTKTAWIHCPTCDADRDASTVIDGICPICEGPVSQEPDPVSEAPAEPKKSKKLQETGKKADLFPEESKITTSNEEPEPPYDPPKFDFTAAEAHPAREMAARILCRRRLLPFIQRFRPKYIPGWVHEDICRRLERFVEQVERGMEPRLMINVPVRHGKSEIGSRHFAPWVLGKHPDWEIISAAGAQSLALSFSRYCRDVMQDRAYQVVFPDTKLDPSSKSVENWNTTGGGGYLAAGTGTMITGRGAHILLIDDAVKDAEAADSQTIRDNTWEWYISTALSRLAPGGGVLIIMCMTGETPVMMADGTQRRLDTLKASDEIATYANGVLASTKVAAVKSNGRDSVLKITMRTGKIVRANQRHPFLTVLPSGGLTWTRAKHLTTDLKIVTVKGSGVNGEALHALPRGARNLPNVADYVHITTQNNDGSQDIAQQVQITNLDATLASSTATASQLPSTTICTTSRVDVALSAANPPKQGTPPDTGRTSSLSTTATTQVKSEGCSVTTVTPESDTLPMSRWHYPPQNISDFTLDEILSVEADGVEEVFDVQVEHTENFIANGVVSHNTWWHEDDLAGRIHQLNDMDNGGDKFEIIKYPAINDQGDEYILADDTMVQLHPNEPVPDGARLTRPINTALHPERYTHASLIKRKATYAALGQQRWWNSLYQQNPTPDDGLFFTKDMFRYTPAAPQASRCNIFQAWDFAISEGQGNDYTVGSTIYQDERDNLYVVDVRRFKSADSLYIIDEILNYAAEYKATLLGFEDGQIWKTLQAQFDKRCSEKRFYPSYEILKPLTDKKVRAHPLRGRMQAGKIWFIDKAPWLQELFNEMTRFPLGKHDDQIDSLAWNVRLTLGRHAPKPLVAPQLKSWKDKLPGLMAGSRGASHMAS